MAWACSNAHTGHARDGDGPESNKASQAGATFTYRVFMFQRLLVGMRHCYHDRPPRPPLLGRRLGRTSILVDISLIGT